MKHFFNAQKYPQKFWDDASIQISVLFFFFLLVQWDEACGHQVLYLSQCFATITGGEIE